MTDIVVTTPIDINSELDRLAAVYSGAGGAGVKLLNAVGGSAEGLMDKLPSDVKDRLSEMTELALRAAMAAANGSRNIVPDQAEWVNTSVATAMGAAGGFGGLPTALAELPATTAMFLRAVQGVARQYDFDPTAENVQFDCIRIFAAAGPLEKDDGADLGFLSARLALTGGAVQTMIARVAPRLATVMGQKLAAQTVPVLGAVAGAGTNLLYSRYYQQIAHVHFGLRRLSINADVPHADLVEQLRVRMRLRLS